jgi:hypothetical protein
MQAYRVADAHPAWIIGTRYFWINMAIPVDGDTSTDDIVVIREDYKFALYRGQWYRVCEIEFDDERPFIKCWDPDPFKGVDGYEQIG